MKSRIIAFFALLIFSALYSCVKNPVTGRNQVSVMSEAQEIQLGQSSDPQVQAMYGVYDDPKLQEFIDQKGQEMARISHRPELEYHFKIVDSDVVNAFALPGGYVYFTRGIMAHFSNEAEFAGVLGHEIGHITARHGARQQTSQLFSQIGMMAGMILSPQIAANAQAAMQAVQLLNLSFSRSHESESDKLGVEYSSKIGYDAHNMANFFNTLHLLSAAAGQSLPSFLSTHPDPLDRYANVNAMTDEWQAKEGKSDYKTNRDSYLDIIDGIIYGPDPNQGYVSQGQFIHPGLKFKFTPPTNYQLNNQPTQVQMFPKDQSGVLIFTIAGNGTLEEAAKNIQEKQNLTISNSDKGNINTYPALVFEASATNQDQSSSYAVLTYLIKFEDNNVYMFQGITSPDKYGAYKRTFAETAGSFDKETRPEKLNVKPNRINIKTVPSEMTLQQFLQTQGVKNTRFNETAILNSIELTQVLPAKTKIKIIGY